MGPKSPAPNTSLLFEVTSRCNARCGFCYNAARSAEGLDTSSALHLIEKVRDETGAYHVSFSGGEPLLRPDLGDLVRYAKGAGLKVTLVTNGLLIDRDKAAELVESGIDLFQVTLLAADREVHNRLAGGPFFERVVSAIAELVSAGGRVATSFVACKDNVGDFKRTLELNALLRVRQVQFCRLNAGGLSLAAWSRLMPSPGGIDGALRDASATASKYGISVIASVPIMPCLSSVDDLPGIALGFCGVGDPDHTLLAVSALGDLKVCPHSSTSLGSALDTPIPELLRGRGRSDFIESVAEFCKDCPHVAVCRGGCRSAAQACYGDAAEEDPFLKTWKETAVASRNDPAFAQRRIAGRTCAA
jgi:radical SAM protein with 4Fe4S-binding SPASM domain